MHSGHSVRDAASSTACRHPLARLHPAAARRERPRPDSLGRVASAYRALAAARARRDPDLDSLRGAPRFVAALSRG
jgi:hypothetical protein